MFVFVVASIAFFLSWLITSLFLLRNCYVDLVLIPLVELLLPFELHHTIRLRAIMTAFVRY